MKHIMLRDRVNRRTSWVWRSWLQSQAAWQDSRLVEVCFSLQGKLWSRIGFFGVCVCVFFLYCFILPR